ncbi:MAG: Lrp/AsnC family transcriptional regulator [Pseudomonadota bacterium]
MPESKSDAPRASAGPSDHGGERERGSVFGRVTSLASPHDKLNRGIVAMLQEDGRRPYNEIAAALDVSEGTVRNRVSGMRQAGQLRIVAITDPISVEYETAAMLGVKVAPGATPTSVGERLGRLPEVIYVLWVSGRFDLLVEVVAETRADLLHFLDEHAHEMTDIATVETMTGLRNFKNQFLLKQNWP